MKNTNLLTILALIILSPTSSFAGSVTLTTYYPAPTGNYDKLNVSNGLNNDGKDFTLGDAVKSNNTFHGNNTIGESDKKAVINGEVDLGTNGKNLNIKGNPKFLSTVTMSHGLLLSTSNINELINITSPAKFTSDTTFEGNTILGKDWNNFIQLKGNVILGSAGANLTIVNGSNILADNTQIQGANPLIVSNTGGLQVLTGLLVMNNAILQTGNLSIQNGNLSVNGNTNLGTIAQNKTVIKGKINLDDGSSNNSEAPLKVKIVDNGADKGYYAVYAP